MQWVIVLIVYALTMFGITLLAKRVKTAEGFFVGDRKEGTFKSAFSIASSWIWAPALFVSAERAYVNGTTGLFWFLVPNVLCLILFIPFAKRLRKIMPQGITLAGYMSEKYNKRVKWAYLFQLSALNTFSTAVQLLAGSKILSLITGLPFVTMTIVLAVIAATYSLIAGIKASILTDVVQLIIILTLGGVFVFFALRDSGFPAVIDGFSGISGEYGSLFSAKGLELFFAFGLPTTIGLISGPFGDQTYWQRAFTVREDKLGKAFAIGAGIFAIVPLLMATFGFIAAGTGFIANDTGIVNFEYLTNIFPAWIALPFLFLILSGLLSTVNSNICAVSSLVAEHNGLGSLKLPRISMLIVLVLGILIANIPGLTVTHLFLFYGTLRASTLLPTVLTLKGVKLSADGVFFGILTALLVGLPIFAYGNLANIALYKTLGSLTTVLSSAVVAITVTMLSKRGDRA